MNFEKINELSSIALVDARDKIEKALEENFFDSTMSESDKARFINLAQIVAQISATVTAGVILGHLNQEKR